MRTVLIVDDHPVFRRGLAALLTADGMQIVGETASGVEAVQLATQLRPDLVVMDLALPDTDGLVATTRQLLQQTPETHVIVVSMYHDDTALARALEAGAQGYVPKDAPPEHLIAAIRLVVAGGVAVSPQLAPQVPRLIAGGAVRRASLAEDQFPQLSPRERQVLAMLSDNLTNTVIAERLGVSPKTVANYVSLICMRLGVPDRRAAARVANDTLRGRH
ncbi:MULTISPECIES: response regulator transcription factor [unclassified Kribbella]|uniref:response regulator transcription factor n=1 Tax=unclassified Kribbella TaxID=2644121 RepID=UPI0030193B19